MTPVPEVGREIYEESTNDSDNSFEGNDIVISGMSGTYPKARNVEELSEILYNKVNPVSKTSRWNLKHPDILNHLGEVPDLDKFDAQFFTVNSRLSKNTDAAARKLLEHTFMALYDAGVSPQELTGKKVGVYIGVGLCESESTFIIDEKKKSQCLSLIGCNRSLFANRISYWLDLKGPSYAFDALSCGSTVALHYAYLAISNGVCEAAIVGGTNLCLHPQSSLLYGREILLSKDGKTRSFDQYADGTVRSEAVNVLFLQRAEDANRIHGRVLHVKSEFTAKPSVNAEFVKKFELNNDLTSESRFLHNFYEEARVSTAAVQYVEAFGSGSPQADETELKAISEVFCKDRIEPLLVGCVTSNIGYTEAASGISSITKVLLGYHTGKLAANLHYQTPRKDISAICDGRMRIITDHTRFGRTYVAVNGKSLTGIKSHVLLHGHFKPKNLSVYHCKIPRLVTISGRMDSSVVKIFDHLKSHPIDAEELALLHNIHSNRITGHLSRGFTILGSNKNGKTESLMEKVKYYDNIERPLYFIYSGMGSQWPGMGGYLMQIPTFAAAIERCQKILKPKGVDVIKIISSPEKTILDNVLYCFVGITAIQIGLTDILRELGVEPNKIIGHSLGEIGCAYADGCFTAEEAILASYVRGVVSTEIAFIPGSMAAVGVGTKTILSFCPPEIEIACHNGPHCCTISGPTKEMADFITQLAAKGIFAKEVPCSNIAYHSRYVSQAGPGLLKHLKELIKKPKLRSERWLSTSVPQEKWQQDEARYSSAEYFTNNLLNPVLFEEVLELIPKDAVLIEIAPHGLLQAILTRSLPSTCRNIPLTRRDRDNNMAFLLQAIGNIYIEGYTIQVQNLYPKVEFPVSTETPLLSHLVEWVHQENWAVPLLQETGKMFSANCHFLVSSHDDEFSYLEGHTINGMTRFPFAAALVLVWDTLAMTLALPKKQLSVQFHNIRFYSQPVLQSEQVAKLCVKLQRGSGYFEVTYEDIDVLVATGHILHQVHMFEANAFSYVIKSSQAEELTSRDVYQLFNEKGYFYRHQFCSIDKTNSVFDKADLIWDYNWVTLIDGMLQLNVLRRHHNSVSLPRYIRKITIDIKEHLKHTEGKTNSMLKAHVSECHNFTRCGGILLENIIFFEVAPMIPEKFVLVDTNFNRNNLGFGMKDTKHYTQRNGNNATLICEEMGKLDSLQWFEIPETSECEICVSVDYASVCNYDVKTALGMISSTNNDFRNRLHGMDFSGTTKSGERVMGILQGGAAALQVAAHSDLLWPVPDHWSLEEAATVPWAYAQAFYCLFIKHTLQPGISILIHGGAGALGQAVISIALAHNCKVFTTVSDVKKKQFLLKLFPELKGENIMDSRDYSFGQKILIATQGNGCNLIISCAKGNFKDITIKCGSRYSVVLDTVQLLEHEAYEYGMNYMFKTTYKPIDFMNIFQNSGQRKVLNVMLRDGITQGYVRPLTRVVYSPDDVIRAFRLLEEGRQRGRVLLNLKAPMTAINPRIICYARHSHLIICENEIFGLLWADRLIERGARKLLLHCSQGFANMRQKLRNWEQLGVESKVSSIDLSEVNAITSLLVDCMKMGPLETLFIFSTDAANTMSSKEKIILMKNVKKSVSTYCRDLKIFAIITDCKDIENQICTSQTNNKFPIKILQVPKLQVCNIDQEYAMGVLRGIINITEQSLFNKENVLTACHIKEKIDSLLQQIAVAAGVKILGKVSDDATLQDLGITYDKSESVCAYLWNKYMLYYDREQIPKLTIQNIQEMKKNMSEYNFVERKGLEKFISYENIDSDELRASSSLLFMSTLTFQESMRDEYFDMDEPCLCIIPGIEGHYKRFQPLCKRLKVHAFVLQPELDALGESIEETAKRYAKILLQGKKKWDHFYLLGYECGILTTLEVASILEDHGITCTVFCVGLSPSELKQMIQEELINIEDELNQILKKIKKQHTHQYINAMIKSINMRIVQVKNYRNEPKILVSQLILLRVPYVTEIKQNSNLQDFSRLPIIEYQLRAPMEDATRDGRCAAIINHHLDIKVLKDFEMKNMCISNSFKLKFKN